MTAMTDAEHQLWEDYHEGYSPSVACDRKALTETFPNLVPADLRANIKYVPIERAVLWQQLTGTKLQKNDWNR